MRFIAAVTATLSPVQLNSIPRSDERPQATRMPQRAFHPVNSRVGEEPRAEGALGAMGVAAIRGNRY
jgi:hypothetical protein